MIEVLGANVTQNQFAGRNFAVNDPDIFSDHDDLEPQMDLLLSRGITICRVAWNYNQVDVAHDWDRMIDQVTRASDRGMRLQFVFGGDDAEGTRGQIPSADRFRYLDAVEKINGRLGDRIDSWELVNEPFGEGNWSDWRTRAGWFAWSLRKFLPAASRIVIPAASYQGDFGGDGFVPISSTSVPNHVYAMHQYPFWYDTWDGRKNQTHIEKQGWTQGQWDQYWNGRYGKVLNSGVWVQCNEYGLGRRDVGTGNFQERWMGHWMSWCERQDNMREMHLFHGTISPSAVHHPNQHNRTYCVIDQDHPDGALRFAEDHLALHLPSAGWGVAPDTIDVDWPAKTVTARFADRPAQVYDIVRRT